MDVTKRARLEANGWRVGTVAEFLDLTPEEESLVEMKVALGDALRSREAAFSQTEIAKKVPAYRHPIVMDANNATAVSLEGLVRAMLAVGATPKEIGTVIASIDS